MCRFKSFPSASEFPFHFILRIDSRIFVSQGAERTSVTPRFLSCASSFAFHFNIQLQRSTSIRRSPPPSPIPLSCASLVSCAVSYPLGLQLCIKRKCFVLLSISLLPRKICRQFLPLHINDFASYFSMFFKCQASKKNGGCACTIALRAKIPNFTLY